MAIWNRRRGGVKQPSVEAGRIDPDAIQGIYVICNEGDETLTLDKSEFVMRVFSSQNLSMFKALHARKRWGTFKLGFGPFPEEERTDPQKLAAMLDDEFDKDRSAYIQSLSIDISGASAPKNVTVITVFETPATWPKKSYMVVIARPIEPFT